MRQQNAGVGEFTLPSRAHATANREEAARLTETAILSARVVNETRFQFVRGTVLGEQGKLAEAITDFDRAVELDPQFALAYANRGLARLRRGEDYIAKKDFRLCLGLDPKLKDEIEALSVVAKKRRIHKMRDRKI